MSRIESFLQSHPVPMFVDQYQCLARVLTDLEPFDHKRHHLTIKKNAQNAWIPVISKKNRLVAWITAFWKPQVKRADFVAASIIKFLDQNVEGLKHKDQSERALKIIIKLNAAHIWNEEQRRTLNDIYTQIGVSNEINAAQIKGDQIINKARMKEKQILESVQSHRDQILAEALEKYEENLGKVKTDLNDEVNSLKTEIETLNKIQDNLVKLNKEIEETYKENQIKAQEIREGLIKNNPEAFDIAFFAKDGIKTLASSYFFKNVSSILNEHRKEFKKDEEKYKSDLPHVKYYIPLEDFPFNIIKLYVDKKMGLETEKLTHEELNGLIVLSDYFIDKEFSYQLSETYKNEIEELYQGMLATGEMEQWVLYRFISEPKPTLKSDYAKDIHPNTIIELLKSNIVHHLSELEIFEEVNTWLEKKEEYSNDKEKFWLGTFENNGKEVRPLDLIRSELFTVKENQTFYSKLDELGIKESPKLPNEPRPKRINYI
ncbi:MAG: hypothetical protein Tsb0021_08930 [Chlamydiales bacterium]